VETAGNWRRHSAWRIAKTIPEFLCRKYRIKYPLLCSIILILPLGCSSEAVKSSGQVSHQAINLEGNHEQIIASTEPPPKKIVNIKSSTHPISFFQVIIKIPSGSVIGSHHDGLLKLAKETHHWNAGTVVGTSEFKEMAVDKLLKSGFNVLGNDGNIFGNDNSSKARFMLGCIIESMSYNTYGRLAGNYSETRLSVGWQLMDTKKNDVVFKSATSGHAMMYDDMGVRSIFGAFIDALNYLVIDAKFIEAIEIKNEMQADIEGQISHIKINKCDKEIVAIPSDIDKVMESIIVIKAGLAIGSGFIVSEDGYILTAAHIIDGLSEVNVEFRSRLNLLAKVIKLDKSNDISILKIPGTGHRCLPLNLNKALVGSEVYAIGAPIGLSFTVTKGVIGGYRLENGVEYIQTDASINPGNSGGPMVDSKGMVIGIVVSKIVGIQIEGLSFGCPTSVVANALGLKLEQ
jgi:S1-C subfamily serine protease